VGQIFIKGAFRFALPAQCCWGGYEVHRDDDSPEKLSKNDEAIERVERRMLMFATKLVYPGTIGNLTLGSAVFLEGREELMPSFPDWRGLFKYL
jgi:hypothetical protein